MVSKSNSLVNINHHRSSSYDGSSPSSRSSIKVCLNDDALIFWWVAEIVFYLWEASACLVFVIKCLIVVILMFDLYVLWRNMLNGD